MHNSTVQSDFSSPEEPTQNQRVALLVEYCGDAFHGNQFQPGRPTVQQALQEALAGLNLPASAVSFAGRTDAGVHARGQVAHFDIAKAAMANVQDLSGALNALLPETVSVKAVHFTDRRFNSRREATCKWYRYVIYNHPSRSAWAGRQAAAHVRPLLDAARMDEAAKLILGLHDFRSFKDSATQEVDDICHIQHAQVRRDGDFIIFDIVADRFLYKMIRNLTGQLMTIGHSERPLPPETILSVMAERDRRKAAATAKPDGLSLMAILYQAPFNFFDADVHVRQLKQILKHPQLESLQNDNENLFRKAS
ncbi:MAG TPA: tRNA pseudouridine(38-40) synthase TruA [Coleofasciculaceae cyanobacterium]